MNIAAIDLNLLVAFEALWEERHLSRAAVRVGLSQPAMSNALRRLRALFGDVLFVRAARGMTPTTRATEIAAPVHAGLAHLRLALEDRMDFDPSTAERTFRIAMNDYAEMRLGGALMRRLLVQAPGVEVILRRSERLFVAPEEELRNRTVDAAIGFFREGTPVDDAVRYKDLYTESNVVIARRGHPILGRLTAATFASAEHVAVFYKAEPRGLIDEVLAAQGLARRVRAKVSHFLAVPQIVASSELIACVPAGLAAAFAGWLDLEIRPLPIELPPMCLRLVWNERLTDDPSHRWFRRLLEKSAMPEEDAAPATGGV